MAGEIEGIIAGIKDLWWLIGILAVLVLGLYFISDTGKNACETSGLKLLIQSHGNNYCANITEDEMKDIVKKNGGEANFTITIKDMYKGIECSVCGIVYQDE